MRDAPKTGLTQIAFSGHQGGDHVGRRVSVADRTVEYVENCATMEEVLRGFVEDGAAADVDEAIPRSAASVVP